MRLNVTPDLHINHFSGAVITELDAGITNGVVEIRGDIPYLTQRPPMDIFGDASDTISDARGRAIHYWDLASALYIFNADTIYKTSYSTVLSTSPTTGTKPCSFLEVGGILVLLDAENDEGWTITTGGSVAAIASNFPATLAYGGASMDTYLFVMDESVVIWHCDSNDPATWNALSFITAEMEPDGGVYLAKHHDTICALGFSTTEFFYNAGNTSGSVLSRRQDISYNIGCSTGESVWEEGDRIFWIGTNPSGSLGVYTMVNFNISKVSTATIDSFLTQSIERDEFSAVGCGLSGQGHVYYTITIYHTPSDVTPVITLVWDDVVQKWYEWNMTVNGLTKFDLVSWTKRGGAEQRFGEGILSNGDLVAVNDGLGVQDTLLGATYVVTDYVESGYVQQSQDSGTAIDLTCRMGMMDGGVNKFKYPTEYRFVGDETENSQTLTLKWANENNSSFSTGVTMDTSKYQKITRPGRYRRRNHELSYSGTERLRLEALETDPTAGEN